LSTVQAGHEDEAVSNENSQSRAVSISNASGPRAALLNGQYFPNPIDSPGRVVYRKKDDPSMCIEHRAGMWQLKTTSNMGTDQCIAAVKGGCALHACAYNEWKFKQN
jgi:hypothetical protein